MHQFSSSVIFLEQVYMITSYFYHGWRFYSWCVIPSLLQSKDLDIQSWACCWHWVTAAGVNFRTQEYGPSLFLKLYWDTRLCWAFFRLLAASFYPIFSFCLCSSRYLEAYTTVSTGWSCVHVLVKASMAALCFDQKWVLPEAVQWKHEKLSEKQIMLQVSICPTSGFFWVSFLRITIRIPKNLYMSLFYWGCSRIFLWASLLSRVQCKCWGKARCEIL